jgi:hypothetical protein
LRVNVGACALAVEDSGLVVVAAGDHGAADSDIRSPYSHWSELSRFVTRRCRQPR